MSEEPQDTDHALNVRLARLCGIPVVNVDDWESTVYPIIVACDSIASPPLSIFETDDAPVAPWNPLEDERQAFRWVVKALGRMGLSWSVASKADEVGGSARIWRFCEKRLGETVDIHELMTVVDCGGYASVARPICLAALEAAEKLEEACECGCQVCHRAYQDFLSSE